MTHIQVLIHALGAMLVRYGGWGLFCLAFLDSSFLAFPVVNDLLLIQLSSSRPSHALMYALLSTTGSVLGALTLYTISRAGRNVLIGRDKPAASPRVQKWIQRNDFLSILVGSLLPPPTPFKLFCIAAGGLRVSPARFVLALAVGRAIRFSGEAWLAARYGLAAEAYLKKNVVWVSLALAAIVLLVAVIIRRFNRNAAATS